MHQSVQEFFDDVLDNAQKKFQEFQNYFSQHHNSFGAQASGQISSSFEFVQNSPAVNTTRNNTKPKKSVTFGASQYRYFYGDDQPTLLLTPEELFDAQSSELSSKPAQLEHAETSLESSRLQHIEISSKPAHLEDTETYSEPAHPEHAETSLESSRLQHIEISSKPAYLEHTEISSEPSHPEHAETSLESSRFQHIEISSKPAYLEQTEISSEPSHPEHAETSLESSRFQHIEISSKPAYLEHTEISSEPSHLEDTETSSESSYPQSSEDLSETFLDEFSSQMLRNLLFLNEKMLELNSKILELKIKLDSFQNQFNLGFDDYESGNCREPSDYLFNISECLKCLGVVGNGLSNSDHIKTEVCDDDTSSVDCYDNIYQQYYLNMVMYKYLSFLSVIQYDKILELPKINALINRSYSSPQHEEIVQIILNNLESAIDFFIDYSQNIQNYNLQLSLKDIKNFIKIYEKLSTTISKNELIKQGYDRLTSNFNLQKKVKAVIDFFTNNDPQDTKLITANLKFIEEEILKSINSSERYLSDLQLRKCCEIYFRYTDQNYNANTVIIQQFYFRLRSSMPKKGQSVKAPIDYYEERDKTATHLPTIPELTIEKDILKQEFINGLKIINSSFNLRTIPSSEQLTMNPLIIDASRVERERKYPIGTEILL